MSDQTLRDALIDNLIGMCAFIGRAQEYPCAQTVRTREEYCTACLAAARLAILTARCEALQRDYSAAQAHVAELSLEERDLRKRCEALETQLEIAKRIPSAWSEALDTLRGRCEALERSLTAAQNQAGDMQLMANEEEQRAIAAELRCEALTAERDKWASQTARLACFTTWLGVPMDANLEDAVTQSIVRARASASKQADSRCQHLEQAVKEASRRDESLRLIIKNLEGMLKTEDEESAETRVSFAAGYTAALDDVLNETPEPSHD